MFIELNQIEKRILSFLWEKNSATSKEIQSGLKGKTMALPTISQALRFLVIKKLINVEKKDGNRYFYSASISKKEFVLKVIRNLCEELYHGECDELYQLLNSGLS